MPRNLSPFFSAGMKRPDPRPARALIEELEPRLLYSADFAPALADALAPQVEQRIIGIDGNFTNTTDSLQQAQHIQLEVVFLDLSVQRYQQILADIHEQNTSGRSIEVVLLDAERDGVEQIGDFLRQHQNIDAIHVISHGSDGEIQLGTTTLNLDSLLKNATLIKAWGNSLNADADILLYGCDVAQSADGRALVDALSRLTGADVAASDDLTGNAVLGGDWALEYRLGAIEARVAISAQAQAGFEGVLLSPVGTETLANTTTSNIQDNSVNNVSATALFGGPRSVASDASGNFVMVWDSFLQDGSGWGIYAQRFDATGAKAGAEFQVNSTTANNQVYSSVAMATNGNFLVTWTSTPDAGGDTGVYAQLYNAAGTAIGGQLLVNTTTTGRQQWSSAAFDDSGNSLVTWASAAQDGSGYGIYAQRFNATGSMLGGEFQVNTTTASDQLYPSVAMAANGNFVETWTSAAQDGSGTGIYAQRFDAAGTKLGAEFRVNATTANDQLYSRVATDASGNFVIVWQSASQDGGSTGVYAQRYDAAGTALGANSKVNTTTANDQSFPNIAMAPTGEFVVAWASSGQDGNGWGIYAQNYDASGSAVGSEYLVNTTTAGDQLYPSLAMPSARSVIVAWSGNGTGDKDGMYFQRYMNAAPVLNSTKSPTLTSQNEDAGAPVGAGGTLVSSLVDFAAPAGQIDNVTDPDSGALLGIAVTAADATNGSWWYSINSGTNWSGLGTVSDASARLLTADANTRLYFQPNADWNGTITHAITFRAWDQTSGSNGALGDTTVNGGNAAFSTATGTASLVINAVNDAPVVTTTGTALAYTENQAATAIDGALTVSDVDSANLTGATVTISANYANGEDVLAFTNQNGITGSCSGTTTVAS